MALATIFACTLTFLVARRTKNFIQMIQDNSTNFIKTKIAKMKTIDVIKRNSGGIVSITDMCSESLKRSDKMLLYWFTLMLTLWKSKRGGIMHRTT